jgi:hypothetical protein
VPGCCVFLKVNWLPSNPYEKKKKSPQSTQIRDTLKSKGLEFEIWAVSGHVKAIALAKRLHHAQLLQPSDRSIAPSHRQVVFPPWFPSRQRSSCLSCSWPSRQPGRSYPVRSLVPPFRDVRPLVSAPIYLPVGTACRPSAQHIYVHVDMAQNVLTLLSAGSSTGLLFERLIR